MKSFNKVLLASALFFGAVFGMLLEISCKNSSSGADSFLPQSPAGTTQAPEAPESSYTFHNTVTPCGTVSLNGKEYDLVYFGDWPQAIKAQGVVVDESASMTMGAFTYYKGSDNFWYVKCRENLRREDRTIMYSDGVTCAQPYRANSYQYFKVEPIKWRVLSDNYDGKKILLAESVLAGSVLFYDCRVERTIDGKTVSPNNYKHSIVRAWLNGLSYVKKSSDSGEQAIESCYEGKGFLQSAFLPSVIDGTIKAVEVDNSAASIENTRDKVFLLSSQEAASGFYGFDGAGDARRKLLTDYAIANYVNNIIEGYGTWWLRSPKIDENDFNASLKALLVSSRNIEETFVDDDITACGIVPAVCIAADTPTATQKVYVRVAEGDQNGSLACDKNSNVCLDETVTLTVSPASGYSLESLSVKDADGKDLPFRAQVGDALRFTFSMPVSDVNVSAVFKNYDYSFHQSVEPLSAGTGGSAGKAASYVLFGDWPQTIRNASKVAINTSFTKTMGDLTYCKGSDGAWYCQTVATPYPDPSIPGHGQKCSDGSVINKDSSYWFKVEPIKWRVLTNDYNGSGKKLLLAERGLETQRFHHDTNAGKGMVPCRYDMSAIRAYLNGRSYQYWPGSATVDLQSDDSYVAKGFLQGAFTADAQSLIQDTEIQNDIQSALPANYSSFSDEQKGDWGNGSNENIPNVVVTDKIFLLSVKEVTDSYFAEYNVEDSSRVRLASDYALAHYASVYSNMGGNWWLRTPHYNNGAYVCVARFDGSVKSLAPFTLEHVYVLVVPALTVNY